MTATERMTPIRFWRLARTRAKAGHLSAPRQAAEGVFLYFAYGVSPGYYQLSGFWDRSVSWRLKTHHLSASAFKKRLAQLNPPAYRKISQNKLAEKALLTALGLPTPKYLGYYQHGIGVSPTGELLTDPETLERFLDVRTDLGRVCFKGVEGWGGQSFESVDIVRAPDGLQLKRLKNSRKLTVSDFCHTILSQGQYASGAVIEAFQEQHDVLSRLNSSSLNTLRIWVLQETDGTTRALLAFLRIGRAGDVVDNLSAGGLNAPVDLDTGVLCQAMDGTPARRTADAHPDHGADIAGIALPYFEQALRVAEKSVRLCPGIRFAGVDIAIAPRGPVVIELNVVPGRLGAAMTGFPSRRLLYPDDKSGPAKSSRP